MVIGFALPGTLVGLVAISEADSLQDIFRKKLQKAYQQKNYKKAKKELNSIRKELNLINQSAVNSLDEGFEETLTLHRLGVFKQLGISLKTSQLY